MKTKFILFVICFSWCGCAFCATVPTSTTKNQPQLKSTLPMISPAPRKVLPNSKTAINGGKQGVETTLPPVAPQPVDFGVCNKIFKLDNQKLFYLTLAGVNANRFKIDEIQSKSGYILFSVSQRQFIANILKIDSANSMLKITPCNNVYFFPTGIVQNMFKYIELNINTPIQKLSIL